jgi:hypothetical protein
MRRTGAAGKTKWSRTGALLCEFEAGIALRRLRFAGRQVVAQDRACRESKEIAPVHECILGTCSEKHSIDFVDEL